MDNEKRGGKGYPAPRGAMTLKLKRAYEKVFWTHVNKPIWCFMHCKH